MKKNIWVVLVNYFGAEDSIECIDSLKKNNTDINILVVDNSNDKKEKAKICTIPNVNYIDARSNLGFAEANNMGIEFAIQNKATHIVLLNNDTIIDSQMISELLKNSDDNSICVPKMLYYYDRNKVWYGGGEINRITGNVRVETINKYDEKVKTCTFATGCCMLLPVSVIKKFDFIFDSNLFMYCEDTEFCIRADILGVKIKYVPSAKLWHKVSASSGGSMSPLSIYYTSRNRLYYIQKHKEYFHITAKWLAVSSRIARIIQYRIEGNPLWKAYYQALIDSKNNVYGRVDIKL